MSTERGFDDRRPGLRPPRFGLGTLFGAVAVLGVFFALIGYLGSHATLLVVLLALAVVAHVAGNALGTQLRANGDTPLAADGSNTPSKPSYRKAAQSDFAPVSRLHGRHALGRPILVITAAGCLLGAVLGGIGLFFLIPIELSWSALGNIAIGMFAAGILGGIWTFLAASFIQVASGALWQAMREANKR